VPTQDKQFWLLSPNYPDAASLDAPKQLSPHVVIGLKQPGVQDRLRSPD